LRGLAKTLSLPRVPTSYRYGKGIVQLKKKNLFYSEILFDLSRRNMEPKKKLFWGNLFFFFFFFFFLKKRYNEMLKEQRDYKRTFLNEF